MKYWKEKQRGDSPEHERADEQTLFDKLVNYLSMEDGWAVLRQDDTATNGSPELIAVVATESMADALIRVLEGTKAPSRPGNHALLVEDVRRLAKALEGRNDKAVVPVDVSYGEVQTEHIFLRLDRVRVSSQASDVLELVISLIDAENDNVDEADSGDDDDLRRGSGD